MVLRNCEVCKHDDVEFIEREFLSEHITGAEAADALQTTQGKFKKHIESHLKRDIAGALAANAGPLAKRIFDKTNELIGSCDRMLVMISEVEKEWKDKKKPEWVNAAIKLEQTLSGNIEKLSKITGELRESSTIRVETLNMQVNNMTQEIIENMCPACKTKILPTLLKNVISNETATKS